MRRSKQCRCLYCDCPPAHHDDKGRCMICRNKQSPSYHINCKSRLKVSWWTCDQHFFEPYGPEYKCKRCGLIKRPSNINGFIPEFL